MADLPYLCTGTLGRIPWDDKARAASAAGFGRLSIYGREHRKLHERGWDDDAIVDLLSELNLRVAEYDGAVMTMRSPDGAEEVVAAAAALGARSITVLEHTVAGQPPWVPGEHIAQAATTLAEIADQAADHEILALIEPFAWSPLDDHRVAAEIIDRADRPNAGLLVDTWHLGRGPERGRLDPAIDPARINALQVSDLAPAPSTAQTSEEVAYESIHHRLLPGHGHGHIAEFLAELARRGVDAPIAVEVFSDDLNTLPPEQAARLALTALTQVLPQPPSTTIP
ncbi:sugar phosphate isomerase/epimerase family protein [Candidatus Poriferisocius sp.]|uniref:sugar phosphate isomerase/epimerase family protein n=1 Tax=Candidatus Poriferisocius sp. TaxID=3101276 RepID=UPI003B5ADB2B